jgi:DNA-binding GntR family transcriptional regulator
MSQLPPALPPPQSIVEHVTSALRSSIQNGLLPPGARLVEQKLVETYSVSHIPIREALARLTEEGLVEHFPRRGSRVASFDLKTLQELSSVRIVLEQYVVELAQEHWSPGSNKELGAIASDMAKAAADSDIDRLFSLDCQFHAQLWSLTGNAVLTEVASHLRSRINRFLLAANRTLPPTALRAHARSHVRLLNAIGSGDIGKARDAMRDHVEIAWARINANIRP